MILKKESRKNKRSRIRSSTIKGIRFILAESRKELLVYEFYLGVESLEESINMQFMIITEGGWGPSSAFAWYSGFYVWFWCAGSMIPQTHRTYYIYQSCKRSAWRSLQLYASFVFSFTNHFLLENCWQLELCSYDVLSSRCLILSVVAPLLPGVKIPTYRGQYLLLFVYEFDVESWSLEVKDLINVEWWMFGDELLKLSAQLKLKTINFSGLKFGDGAALARLHNV